MIAIDMPDNISTPTNITKITVAAFQDFLNSEYRDLFGGLELVFRHALSHRRMARISVPAHSYDKAPSFLESDWDQPGRLKAWAAGYTSLR